MAKAWSLASLTPAMVPTLRMLDAATGPAADVWDRLQWGVAMRRIADGDALGFAAVCRGPAGDAQIAGYAVYTTPADDATVTRLRKLGVVKNWRLRGIGRSLCDVLRDDVPLFAAVDEYDLPTQKFFRAIGWRGRVDPADRRRIRFDRSAPTT